MGDGVLLVDVIVLFEDIVAVVDFEVLGDGDVVACLLCEVVAVPLGCEVLRVVGGKDGRPLYQKLVDHMQPIVAGQRSLPSLHVPVVERRSLRVEFLLNWLGQCVLLISPPNFRLSWVAASSLSLILVS